MAQKKLTRIGENYWNHVLYKDEKGNYYLDINDGDGEPNICEACPSDDPDGEPGWPIEDYTIVNPFTEKEKRERKFRFEYSMLGRLKNDCDGFLSEGDCRYHNPQGICGYTVENHIEKMKEFWNKIPEDLKPEWLTWEQILDYESRMNAA